MWDRMLDTDPARLCARMSDGDRRRPPARPSVPFSTPLPRRPRGRCRHAATRAHRAPSRGRPRQNVVQPTAASGGPFLEVIGPQVRAIVSSALPRTSAASAHLPMRPRHPHRPPARRRPDPETAHVMVGQFRDVTPKRFVRTAARNVELQPAPPTASTRSCSGGSDGVRTFDRLFPLRVHPANPLARTSCRPWLRAIDCGLDSERTAGATCRAGSLPGDAPGGAPGGAPGVLSRELFSALV